jgi:hypothetical protein
MLFGQNFRMNPYNEDLLVIGPIEDPYSTPLRDASDRAPEIVMVQFFLRRRLEAVYLASLRIYT